MIQNWIVTGDTHGEICFRLRKIKENMTEYKPEETAIIILGDVSLNYTLRKQDFRKKHEVSRYGYTLYCVRGNHEARPEKVKGMKLIYDESVHGMVYMEDNFPLIRYFQDGGEYIIDGYSVLVVGGAYSVDKHQRLAADMIWYSDELLSIEEMNQILAKVKGKKFDFVFTHTAPISWEPTDLFLGFIRQDTVDKSMEIWMDILREAINWKIWCFGHFHADRIERPRVEQFYQEYENLNTVWNRWEGNKTFENEWWLPKSPNFYL